jgi:hypothetical protein
VCRYGAAVVDAAGVAWTWGLNTTVGLPLQGKCFTFVFVPRNELRMHFYTAMGSFNVNISFNT